MIKVLLQNANFLLLDEPTNHLDIQSKDILLKALQAYKGTIVFVSHDQDFVNKLATDVIELSADGVREYQGNYELYLYQKKQEELKQLADNKGAQKTQSVKKEEAVTKKQNSGSSVDTKALERKITKLEHDINKVEHSFAQLTFGTSAFDDAQKKLHSLRKELEATMAEWEAYQN
jgi:ATP-binding cassette, subfamily F, member 3